MKTTPAITAEQMAQLQAPIIAAEISNIWLVGPNAHDDAPPDARWTFLVAFKDYSSKKHANFEAALATIFSGRASAITVRHLLEQIPTEDAEQLIKESIRIFPVTN